MRRNAASLHAGIAQLVEQLICNQQVVGSNPSAGSPWESFGHKSFPGDGWIAIGPNSLCLDSFRASSVGQYRPALAHTRSISDATRETPFAEDHLHLHGVDPKQRSDLLRVAARFSAIAATGGAWASDSGHNRFAPGTRHCHTTGLVADSEADTCRKLVVPRLQNAGWEDEPHSIAEQRSITDGRIVPVGKGFIRKPPKRVDFLLRYARDFPLAVVEAKVRYKAAADGLQQAKDYAEMLGLKFAYATNGTEIIEFDYFTGRESSRTDYPTPGELWQRYRDGSDIKDAETAERLLTPFNHAVAKGERYYQQIAVNRTVEAILIGQRRLLLTMATGTGKTAVAFQLCWKLWNARWNRTGEHRRPKSSTSPTATSSWINPRTASSPRLAMRGGKSRTAS